MNATELSTTMGIFENMKVAVHRVQLTREASLIDIEILARKQLFGIEIFDLLRRASPQARMDIFLHHVDVTGAELYMNCDEQVRSLTVEQTTKLVQLQELEEDDAYAGRLISIQKTQTELGFIERRIRTCIEQFGVEFYGCTKLMGRKDSHDAHQIVHSARRAPGSSNPSMRGPIIKCIQNVQRDIWKMESRQSLKEQEARLAEC